MGVRGWLLRRAALRPRVLVAACPYGTRARLLVEAEVAARGWAFALSPAQAGVLAVCGTPGDELSEAVRVVWGELPEPRALVSAAPDASAEEVALALDGAVETLAEGGGGGFERAAYGEVAMAGRGPDRDGLKLDRLHVPLGPVLVDWPAGLVVETVLQGDVIQEAAVRAVSAGETGAAFWPPTSCAGAGAGRWAARHLDGLTRLLGVAGWLGAALEARRLRDLLLAGGGGREVAGDCERLARRVRGSRVLRWMLRGLGTVGHGTGVPGWMRGDVLDRAYRWADAGARAVGGPAGDGCAPGTEAAVALSLLPELLTGTELAVARLIVASLDPDLERLPARQATDG
ncbi:hypothetical protein GCM10022224_068440 [Nonomuraea antimicrobica]|uniref:Uncharacterized protein n=1 Tax=Nonomuraea antimicrobica TaxID=561173 RepID=A0ABP7CM98_9ACTN